jgi:hypothetical protein
MTRVIETGRKVWRAVRGWIQWLRHGQEEVEALYGPNPNNITSEEKIAQAGIISSSPGGHGQSAGF